MITRIQKLDERGIAAAEFAIVLPVLLLLLFGTIEFGMIMYGREVVTNAAREAARAGIVLRPDLSTKPDASKLIKIAKDYIETTGITDVEFTATGAQRPYPSTLTVEATYKYHFLVPYLPALVKIPDPLVIKTQVVMQHE